MKQSLGEFISTLRKAHGFTQAEVAEKLNISNRTLSSWETDRTAPDICVLPALADLYGVTVDEILRSERLPQNAGASKLSDTAETAMRKNRFSKFCAKRILCLGLGLLGGAVFFTACTILLYTSSPLWLDILLMVIGAGGNAACLVLLAYFHYTALRSEGLVFDTDYTEDKKAYALTLRHKLSNAFMINSLPYILGAIIFLIVYFAAGLDYAGVYVGDVFVFVDYTTPTAVLVAINGVIGAGMFIFGLAYTRTGLKKLGNEKQLNKANRNKKLLLKLCGFGAIPIAIPLILLIIFSNVYIESVFEVYFTAHSVDEVYKNFQTLTVENDERYIYDYNEDKSYIIPAGEYFLDFQTDKYIEVTDSHYGNYETVKLYVLGNGFYGKRTDYDNVVLEEGSAFYTWEVLYSPDENITDTASCALYGSYGETTFEFADSGMRRAVQITPVSYIHDWDFDNGFFGYKFENRGIYDAKNNEYRYERICHDDYSPLSGWLFVAVIAVTVTTCAVIWITKREKYEYKF